MLVLALAFMMFAWSLVTPVLLLTLTFVLASQVNSKLKLQKHAEAKSRPMKRQQVSILTLQPLHWTERMPCAGNNPIPQPRPGHKTPPIFRTYSSVLNF